MKKKIFILLLCAAFSIPAYAVFNEKNISRTISVLRHELHLVYQEKHEQDVRHENASQMAEIQHKDMVNTVRWINELTLILYSQDVGFTLDQTYAMDCAMYEYKRFNRRGHPQVLNSNTIDAEIDRYQRLIEALRLLPPRLDAAEEVEDTQSVNLEDLDIELDSFNHLLDSLISTFGAVSEPEETTDTLHGAVEETSLLKALALSGRNVRKEAADMSDNDIVYLPLEAQEDRDSCIVYAKAIVESYTRQKDRMKEDDYYYNEMKRKIQQTYEYAMVCYKDIQNYIFVSGQENYFFVLSHLRKYAADVAADMAQKYGTGKTEQDREGLLESQWRGIVIASTIMYSLVHLLLISLAVVLLCCVVLKNVRPFNTEWFKHTRPVVLLLTISVLYSIYITVCLFFPMGNFMVIAAARVLIYFWFVIALLLSILVGLEKEDVRKALSAFAPVLVMGFILMLFRAMLLPDKMIHLTLSPILLAFLCWQIHVAYKLKAVCDENRNMVRLQFATAVIFGLSLLSSLQGYSLLAMMIVMWWIFQVATLATLVSLGYFMQYYEKRGLKKKKEQYALTHKMVSQNEDGDFIRVTWLHDFIYRAVIPIAGIFSLLGCIWLSFGIFNLSVTCQTVFHKPFFDFASSDGTPILQISLFKLAVVCSCFFLFRYLNYLIRSLYRAEKLEGMMKASGRDFVRKNDVNLTLAYNVIGILIWGMFAILTIAALKIPIGALSIVAAGLATGIGLALKDVLNNFIYGIQLMSGRLRVGDVLECDGVRGTVEKISYQSTEIQTVSGGVISFTNSTLFNKNFQNLTKNSPYEYVAVTVSISYGEDVEKVRNLILDAMKVYMEKKDKYGRSLIDRKVGIWITFDEFADSSVNLAVKQHVLVESKSAYVAEVKELIYKLFNENGITIPFPQQEISILNMPDKRK